MSPQATQPEILASLARFAERYLEVGVQDGRSLMAVCAAGHRLRHVAVCDTWGGESGGTNRGSHDHIAQLLDGLETKPTLTFLDGDSRALLPTLEEPFDLVHIDGGHSADVVTSDLREGWRLCERDLVVHDISFAEVWGAFYAFAQGLPPEATIRCYFGGHGTAVVTRRADAP